MILNEKRNVICEKEIEKKEICSVRKRKYLFKDVNNSNIGI